MHTGSMYMFRLHINLVIIKVSIAALTDGENYPSPPEFKNKSKFVKKKIKLKKIEQNHLQQKYSFSNKAHCLCNSVQ